MELSQVEINDVIALWNEEDADTDRIIKNLESAMKCVEILKILMSKNMIKEKSLCFSTVYWTWNESSEHSITCSGETVKDYKFLETIKPYIMDEDLGIEEYFDMDYKDKELFRVLINNYTFSSMIDDILDEYLIGKRVDIIKERFEILEYCNIPVPVSNIAKILNIDTHDVPFYNSVLEYLILDYKIQDKIGLYQLFKAIQEEMLDDDDDDDNECLMMIANLIRVCFYKKIVTKENYRKYNYFLHFLNRDQFKGDTQHLLEIGMNMDHLNEDGNSVIFHADSKTISFYARMFVDVHHVNNEGKNAMFYVQGKDQLRELMTYNVNPIVNHPLFFKNKDMRKYYRKQILRLGTNQTYVINCLLRMDDINLSIDDKGNSILAYVRDEILRSRLISKGCDPNKKNNKGRTAHQQRTIKTLKPEMIRRPYWTLKKYMNLNDVVISKAIIDRIEDINMFVYSDGKTYTLFCMLIISYVHEVADCDKIREILEYFINKPNLKLDFTNYLDNWRMYDDADETIGKMIEKRNA